MAHVLVVGGTDSLRGVALFLAAHDNTVSIVSNNTLRLKEIEQEAHQQNVRLNPIAVDLRDREALLQALKTAIDKHGPVVLVVNWLSTSGSATSDLVVRIANERSPLCRFFQVMRVTEEGNMKEDFLKDPFANMSKVLYRRILVGMSEDESGVHSTMPSEEICMGVIDAIRNDRHYLEIGWTADSTATSQSA